MRPRFVTRLFSSILITFCSISVSGAGPENAEVVQPSVQELETSPQPSGPPVVQEMRTRLEMERAQLELLNERFRAASTEQEALMVVREIRRLKYQTEMDLVGIQLRYARNSGDLAAIAELEAALRDLKDANDPDETGSSESFDQE